MIFYLISCSGRPIQSHLVSLVEVELKLSKALRQYQHMWEQVLIFRVKGVNSFVDSKSSGLVSNGQPLADVAQVLGSGHFKTDQTRLLSEFREYYHNCETARTLIDINTLVQLRRAQ